MLRRVLLKLSLRSGLLPAQVFLKGVRCPDKEASKTGGFSDIFCGTYNYEDVALKRLRVFQSVEESRRKALTKDFLRESVTWQSLKHEHVLPFLGVDNTVFQQALCMVLPWMPNGNIREVIDLWKRENGGSVAVDGLASQIHTWLHEISLGLEYLHGEHVVHGDLRGYNILIDANVKVRLADFGLAVLADSVSNANSSKREGNVRWLAPEILDPQRFQKESSRQTYESDVYSFGIVCVESSMPDALWDLAAQCWKKDASERPPITELIASVRVSSKLDEGYWLTLVAASMTGETYQCGWVECDSTFTDVNLLFDHERTQPHLSGFVCARCATKFTELSGFKEHLLDNLECEAADSTVRRERWNEAADLYAEGFHLTAAQYFSCILGNHAVCLVSRGLIFAALGRHEDAISEYREAMNQGHTSIFCDFTIGVSHFALEQYDLALKQFELTLERLGDAVGVNYLHFGLDYKLLSIKVLYNKGACLWKLDPDSDGWDIMEDAAEDMRNAQVHDDRVATNHIYSCPIGVSFRAPDERWDV
ncbi:hypothetical protein EUX98_g5711 [Antrodiella citrinella]|uniref:Uncharacterized protein n=1 Tax=Antrodiella citrinella TaxID=2447956 RepID=A0A4S4MQY0_9APHY|nr:hypothetical protein EUX98_g5711 [Antrodiella citrinella]